MTDDDNVFDLKDLSIGVSKNADLSESRMAMNHETVSFSTEINIETDSVVCPNCSFSNLLPKGPLLTMVTDEPVPCWRCGYPLR